MASRRRPARFTSRTVFLPVLVLVITSVLVFLVLVQPWSLRQSSLPLKIGDVAAQDLVASRDIQYVSEVLTEQARVSAERAVAPIYELPDPTVARGQIEKLASLLDGITVIRQDQNSTSQQKAAALAALPDLSLSPNSLEILLLLSDARWSSVQAEALNVLTRVMQSPIRSDDLNAVRQNSPSLVSFMMTDNEARLVVDLISPLVVANSFYSPELTDAARKAARDAVEPVTRSFVKGQTIVSHGQVISDADLEALTTLGLVHTQTQTTYTYIGTAALVILTAFFTAVYFYRRQRPVAADLRGLLLQAVLFLLFLAGARVTIPNRTVLPFLIPLQAFGLLVSALFGMERGMVFALLMGVLAAYGIPDALGLMSYYILTSLCGILALGQARRVGQFLYAAAAIGGAGVAIVAAYRLPFTQWDWIGLATLAGAAFLSGIASAGIALPLQYLLAQFLGLTTALQLLEISRPDFPLLKYSLQRTPGTYQHSLQVANLAEQAAERIQADGLLTRVGALFHDIGKTATPLFFVENQPPNEINSHNDISPQEAAATIVRHVTDGVQLARKHRLPRRIHDFILEHHGTLVTRYQYNQAVQAAGGDASQVDEANFRYPGPSPRSRETAILMLADGVEACARAENPHSDEELHDLVRKVIERCQKDGQLEDAPLSQRDLAAITESFVTTLRVAYHPRLEYPQEQAAGTQAAAKKTGLPALMAKKGK
jgi:putative nucleotidyltransferase with HDIG domain